MVSSFKFKTPKKEVIRMRFSEKELKRENEKLKKWLEHYRKILVKDELGFCKLIPLKMSK